MPLLTKGDTSLPSFLIFPSIRPFSLFFFYILPLADEKDSSLDLHRAFTFYSSIQGSYYQKLYSDSYTIKIKVFLIYLLLPSSSFFFSLISYAMRIYNKLHHVLLHDNYIKMYRFSIVYLIPAKYLRISD